MTYESGLICWRMSDAVGCKMGSCCLANVMAKVGKGGSIRMLFVKLTSCRFGAGGPKERQSLGNKVRGAVEIHLSLRSMTEAARRSCIFLNLQESLEPGFKSRLRHMTQPCSNSSFNSYTHISQHTPLLLPYYNSSCNHNPSQPHIRHRRTPALFL